MTGGVVVGIELGGTKIVVGVASIGGELDRRFRIDTTTPGDTLARVRNVIDAEAGSRLLALGVGSFGPLDLRPGSDTFGQLVSTPKPDWSGTDVVAGTLGNHAVPFALDTDVNAALLGEMVHGGWNEAPTAYLTVGTGIGGALWVDGRLIHGANHPEIGHVAVKRHPNDSYPGRCPYHGDCLEGMAAGPSLEARFGERAEDLGRAAADAAAELSSWYVASGIASLASVLPVERVIIGGGVAHIPGFHHSVHDHLRSLSAHYPPVPFAGEGPDIVPPALGDDAGVLGAIELARRALGSR